MSLTNRRRVVGSSTRVIMRAATPSMSGSEANSRSVTVMTPSVADDRLRKGIVGLSRGQRARGRPAPLSGHVTNR